MKVNSSSSLLAFATGFSLTALAAQAANVSLIPYTGSSDWPASPELETVNAFEVPNAQSSVRNAINLEQSFTLSDPLTVRRIYLGIQDYDPSFEYELRFFQIGGSGANSTSIDDWDQQSGTFTGTQIGGTLSSSTFTGESAVSGNHVLRIDLTGAEEVNLPAGEYFLAANDTSGATDDISFFWKLSNDSGNDYYTEGRFFDDGGIKSQAAYRDYALALSSVPEPGLSVLLLGGVSLLALTRRRAA